MCRRRSGRELLQLEMELSEREGEELRPSFFELYAQGRLTLALRPALRYVLEVLSVRRPGLLFLAEMSDELFTSISLFVEITQLSKKNSTLSESFYGLTRSRNFVSPPSEKLSRQQILISALLIVVIPYLKFKLDQYYVNNRLRQGQDETQRLVGQPPGRPNHLSTTRSSPTISDSVGWKGPLLIGRLTKDRRFRQKCKTGFLELYPSASALYETTFFVFNILYLFKRTRFFNPLLAAQRLVVRRVRGSDIFVDTPSYHNLDSQSGFLSALSVIADKAISGVKCAFIGGVFLIRFLEFYYAAESRLPQRSAYVPPPPAPLFPSNEFDATLLKSSTSCPLCCRPRTNPAACAPSGYVFCYPCVFAYVQEHGKCPVTKLEAGVEDIVRVYDDQTL